MPEALAERRYSILLLIVCVAVLAVGTLLRRRPEAPQPPPAPPDLERLQRLTAERRLRDLSAYLAEASRLGAGRLLSPAGLAWDAGIVLTPPSDPGRTAMAAVISSRPVALTRAPLPPGVPFSLWRAAGASALPRAAVVRPSPGDWLLVVARNHSGEVVFSHGLYQGVEKRSCGTFAYNAVESSAPLSHALIGGGIFTLDGGVVGLIAPCEDRPVAIAAATVADVLARPVSPADLAEQRYGFRAAGGVVTAVWDGSPAALAGLRPGDLIDAVETPPSTVRRRGRVIGLQWPETAEAPPPVRGIAFRADSAVVSSVEPGSPAADAGIAAGDRVLRVDRAAVADAAAAARAIGRANGPAVLSLDRNGRRMEALLRP